jgi:hypothetical protein
MARQPQRFTVGSEVYEVVPLTTSEGLPLAHKLLQAVGSIIGELVDVASLGNPTDEQLAGVVGRAIRHVRLELLTELSGTFSKYTKFKSGELWLELPAYYDDHFSQRYDQWIGWLVESCTLNFRSFFSSSAATSLKKLGGLAKAAAGTAEKDATPTS